MRRICRRLPVPSENCHPQPTSFNVAEVIVVDESGLSGFDLLRYRRHDAAALMCSFDLIELDGADLRAAPPITRSAYALPSASWARPALPQRSPM
jgi:hypothetical protein